MTTRQACIADIDFHNSVAFLEIEVISTPNFEAAHLSSEEENAARHIYSTIVPPLF
jgi:hypothetical protein